MSIYMKHGDVSGDSTHKDHLGWADVQSVKLGLEHQAAQSFDGSTAAYGQRHYTGYDVVRIADRATPLLMQMSSNNFGADTVTFDFVKAHPETGLEMVTFQFVFNEVTIRSIHLEFARDHYIERMHCVFERIDITNVPHGISHSDAVGGHS